MWKAIDNEQKLRYEILLFRTWLLIRSNSLMSCTLKELPLPTIRQLFMQVVYDHQMKDLEQEQSNETTIQDKFLQYVSAQTLTLAEQIAQNYAQKGLVETTKLYKRRETNKTAFLLDNTIDMIENRSKQLIQRIQYDAEHKNKIIFGRIQK